MSHDSHEVLIGIPVKNCAIYLPGLTRQLVNLDWPRHQLRVVMLVNDSVDHSDKACIVAADALNFHGIRCRVEQRDFGFHLAHENRHLPSKQDKRLTILRHLRQYIVDRHLGSADYIFWVDADFVGIPPDTLQKLVAANKDIIIPVYRTSGEEVIYDWSSYHVDSCGRKVFVDELCENIQGEDIVPLTIANAAALVHRHVYQRLARAYEHELDHQEGTALSLNASAEGFQIWLHRGVCIYHACVPGDKPAIPLRQLKRLHRGRRIPGFDAVIRKLQLETPITEPRVRFMLFSHSNNHETLCKAQFETWGRASRDIGFYSNRNDESLPVIKVDHGLEERYENIWNKVRAMVERAYDELLTDYEWFMFGGNDVFVLQDNLRAYLRSDAVATRHSRGEPLYLGRQLKLPECGTIFNSGGSGYVLNRAALRLLYNERSRYEPGPEDVIMAKVLQHAGVYPMDTRDEEGAERFHPLDPIGALNYPASWPDDWFDQCTRDFVRIPGIDGISSNSISFHYMTAEQMYEFWRRLLAAHPIVDQPIPYSF